MVQKEVYLLCQIHKRGNLLERADTILPSKLPQELHVHLYFLLLYCKKVTSIKQRNYQNCRLWIARIYNVCWNSILDLANPEEAPVWIVLEFKSKEVRLTLPGCED